MLQHPGARVPPAHTQAVMLALKSLAIAVVVLVGGAAMAIHALLF